MSRNKNKRTAVWVVVGGILILLLQVGFTGFFSRHTGTDDQAVDIIKQVAPDYRPWVSNLFEFDNALAEPVLFALQASIGIAVIAYYLLKQRKKSL